jgi:serine protease Do
MTKFFMARGGFRVLGGSCHRAGMAMLLVTAFFLATCSLRAADAPLTDRQIAEANKPGTVMIFTRWTSTIQVPREGLNGKALSDFAENQANLGLIQNTKAAKFVALFDELLRHPLQYLVPTSAVYNLDVDSAGTGSGFIVTPDGYIVTNAHVVYADPEELRKTLVSYWAYNQLKQLFQTDYNAFEKVFAPLVGQQTVEDKMNEFVNAELQYYIHYMQIERTQTSVFALMGVAVPGLPTQPKGIPCDIRKVGMPVPGKDVAILKVEQTNLPTVPVGDDGAMNVGDHILVLGYPGAAELNQQQMGVEATLTQGDLSARKTMPGGWQALQTSAEINHGNSGGPAFNDRGEVIGIATFGPSEADVRGINFLVPISIAKEFLNELNIKPQQSRLSRLYQDGIALMGRRHYKGALEKFKEVSDLSPGFPFVQDKIKESRNAIDQGLDRSWIPGTNYIIGAVAIILIILTAVWFLMRRKGGLAEPVAAMPAAAVTPTVVEPGRTGLALSSPAKNSFGSLQCTAGQAAGRRFEITKDGLLIGRDPSKCQIVLNSDAVSKEHAWVVPVDGGTVVIDRGSTNGTFVNSVDSPKISKVRLQNGDKIFIGKDAATFTYYSS